MYIEERHRALGRDATFSWSRALTHPPRCNRTRHRGRHLDFVGAAILVSWGPPSWTGSDVKNAKVAPILLVSIKLLTDYHLRFLSLKGGCISFSESKLVNMPHCWKSHVTVILSITSTSAVAQWKSIRLEISRGRLFP